MSETLGIVIPCYRSAATIGSVVEGALEACDAAGLPVLVMLVDDASPDGDATWEAIETLCAAHRGRVRARRLVRNMGQHNALFCGMQALPPEVGLVVTMDDDGQHRGEDIPALVAPLGGKADLVIGAYGEKRHSGMRNLGGNLVGGLSRHLFGLPADFHLTSFRAMRRFVADYAVDGASEFTYLTAALLSATRRRANVSVRHEPRREGRSGYTLPRALSLAANLVFTHSRLPFYVTVASGLASLLLTAFSLIYILWLRATPEGVTPDWAILMLMMGLQSTMLMAALVSILVYVVRSHRLNQGARMRWRIADER
ncbi:MAG: glycosyltransferase family 2 protein [Roseococcus sp.]